MNILYSFFLILSSRCAMYFILTARPNSAWPCFRSSIAACGWWLPDGMGQLWTPIHPQINHPIATVRTRGSRETGPREEAQQFLEVSSGPSGQGQGDTALSGWAPPWPLGLLTKGQESEPEGNRAEPAKTRAPWQGCLWSRDYQ